MSFVRHTVREETAELYGCHERGVRLSATPEDRRAWAAPQLALQGPWTSPGRLLRDLYRSRDLCVTLARKDFFVRYRRAVLGVLWAVVLPALQAVVLSVVLTRVANIKVHHYPVYIFSGMVGWTYFSSTLAVAATSIVDNAAMSSRIYFPRAILPISACLSNLFSLAISTGILLVVAAVAGARPGFHTLYLIPASAMIFLLTTTLSVALAASHVYFRDTRYAVQAALFVWFYLTPVFYPLDMLRGWPRHIVELNPLTGPVELLHVGGVGGGLDGWGPLVLSGAWVAGLGVVALYLQCRCDRVFADLL